MNSRIGFKQENINTDFDEIQDIAINIANNYNKNVIYNRISQDKSVNEYGNVLLDIVNSSDMYILNGRTSGDLSGKYHFTATEAVLLLIIF